MKNFIELGNEIFFSIPRRIFFVPNKHNVCGCGDCIFDFKSCPVNDKRIILCGRFKRNGFFAMKKNYLYLME